MKKTFLSFMLIGLGCSLFGQETESQIITKDVDHFWIAYDQIIKSTDSLERKKFINELYINKGSEGLKSLMAVRNYQDFELVNNIINYQSYWNSIRGNTGSLVDNKEAIERYLTKLKEIYPALKPANIYFSIGAFRSGGTYDGNKVLFGAEFMLAKENTITTELPERIQKVLKEYAPYDIPLTAVHEYIHTQQKRWEDQSIIHLCVAEGVAEFISTLVTGKPVSPAVKFGKENSERVVDRFMKEVVRNNDIWNWLWSENQNELKVNDLGYFIGYEICERYYNNATDKNKAIKDLIELDYSDELAFEKFVDGTGFLPLKMKEIGIKYELMRPTVKQIVEFENGSQSVALNTTIITIEFSETMSSCCRSFDYDEEKGSEKLIIKKHVGWSEDKKRYSFEVEELKPNTSYGLLISNFAKEDGGNRLAPYSIKFKTHAN